MPPSWRARSPFKLQARSGHSLVHTSKEKSLRGAARKAKEHDDEAVSRTFSRSDAEAARP